MRLAEAWALLELTPDSGMEPAALRRAYLKRIKKVNPEVDPEGFMRLREAFELLTAQVSASAAAESAADGGEIPSPIDPEAVPATVPSTAEAASDPFAPWLRLIEAAKPAERLETAREAVTVLPDHVGARRVLLSLLVPRGRDAFNVLLEGAQRNPEAFADEILWRFPGGIPLETLALWAKEAPPRRLLLIANAFAEQAQPGEVRATLARALGAAADDPQAGGLLPLALRTVFTLCAKGDLAAARESFGMVAAALGAAAMEVGADQRVVILFAVARELTQIAHRLPDSFRRSAAAAAFGGALDQEQFSARVSAENLSILDDWKLNRALKRAPTLARFMSLDQESRKHHRRLARGPLLLPGGGFLMFCVWMAIRLVPTCLGSTSSDYSPSGAELSASPTLNATALRASLRASLNDRCVRAMMTPEARLCDALRTVVDGLDVDTPICSSVRMRMELARTASLGQLPAEYLTLTSQVGIAVDERCPP